MASRDKRLNFGIFAVSFLVPLLYLTLYYARTVDDNRLSSWRWCFQNRSVWSVLIAILAGSVLSYCAVTVSGRRRNRWLVLFLISFVAGSLFWPEPEVIVDASRYFIQAKYLELYGIRYFFEEWGKGIFAWTDMPLVPFLYGVVFRLFGEVRLYLQIFNTIVFSLSTILTYLIGRELWDEEVGFYGGLLLLGVPYLYTQTPLLLVDIATMFFLLLAVFTFMKALKGGGVMIVISAVAVSLSFFSKYSAWLMLTILPVIAMVNLARLRMEPEAAGRTTTLILRMWYIIVLAAVLIVPVVLYKFGVISGQMKLLVAYQKPGLKRWGESFISTFFFQIHPLITAAALCSAFVAVKRRDLRYIVAVWLVALVLLMQIRRIRYIIMVLPMLSLAASYGLQGIKGANVRKFLVGCIVTSSLSVALFAYLPFLREFSAVNLKEAGKFLDSLPERKVEVFTLTPPEPVVNPSVSVPLLDFYTRKEIIYNGYSILTPGEREKIDNSSLKFTLECNTPSFYRSSNYFPEDTVLAVISESATDPLPSEVKRRTSGYRRIGVFDNYEGIFSYRTSVSIYEKEAAGITRGAR